MAQAASAAGLGYKVALHWNKGGGRLDFRDQNATNAMYSTGKNKDPALNPGIYIYMYTISQTFPFKDFFVAQPTKTPNARP